jgi:hypothetical protein
MFLWSVVTTTHHSCGLLETSVNILGKLMRDQNKLGKGKLENANIIVLFLL